MKSRTGKICGDFGGRNRDGSPCQQPRIEGRCSRHTEDEAARLAGEMDLIIQRVRDGEFVKSAVRGTTLSGWAFYVRTVADPKIRKRYLAARTFRDRQKVDRVEKALEDYIVEGLEGGKPDAKLVIFYLTNRARGRWEHIRSLLHKGKISTDMVSKVKVIFEDRGKNALPEKVAVRMPGGGNGPNGGNGANGGD